MNRSELMRDPMSALVKDLFGSAMPLVSDGRGNDQFCMWRADMVLIGFFGEFVNKLKAAVGANARVVVADVETHFLMDERRGSVL
jgi:hypothetical protein